MDKTLETEIAGLRPKVMSVARRFFRASKLDGDPEDVVQDVLLRLWEARHKGILISNTEAWAVSAAKNRCISIWRKRGRLVDSERISPDYLSSSEEASQPIESSEAERIADIALKQLSAGTQRLLELRATGLSLDEIAAVTGRPKSSVKSSISAARKEITKILKQG